MPKFNTTSELLSNIVKYSSVTGNEAGLAVFLTDYLRDQGFATKRIGNSLLISLKKAGTKKALIFNAHIDTVSAGELSNWTVEPLGGEIKDGKVFGLGAADDKASVAAMIKTFEWLKDQELESDFYLMLVEGEEVDGTGTQNVLSFLKQEKTLEKYEYVAAVVGEPTELNAQIGHRGAVLFEVEFTGGSGHASRPQDVPVQAIYDAAKFIQGLEKVQQELIEKYSDELLGSPTICVTNIEGLSGATNKISEKCVLKIDMRPTPQMDEDYRKFIESILPKSARVVADYPTYPGYTSKDAPIVKLFEKLAHDKKVEIAHFASDMCWFSREKIDAIVCGAGKASDIHKADEHVEIAELDKAVELYKSLAKEF